MSSILRRESWATKAVGDRRTVRSEGVESEGIPSPSFRSEGHELHIRLGTIG